MTPANGSAHPRRSFLRLASVGALGLMLDARPSLSQSSSQPSGQPSGQPLRRFVIDSHQHYKPAPDYVERLVKVYRPRNAMACVLTPIAGFEVIKKAAADHPDVIIPYGHVNVDEPGVIKEIQKFADAGFKGIKMHRPKYNWDDFGYFPIYDKLQSLKLLALFHTGIVSGDSGTAHSSPDAVYAFEKLVFGTDEPPENLDTCLARYQAMLNACEVPEASRKKIYGETLAKILGIKVRA
jgi:predicted TIM-barrel fold metal-dependent hydrolase